MKTYQNLWISFLISLCFLYSAILQSCSDDLGYKTETGNIESRMVRLCIPANERSVNYGSTKTDGNVNSKALEEVEEARINTIWFYAFPVDSEGNPDNTRGRVCQSLVPSNGNDFLSYTSYSVGPFEDGDYHIYVLANLENYLPDGTLSSSTEENIVKNLVLNFSTKNYLQSGNLPMACLNTEIKIGSSETQVSSGIYTFNSKIPENNIYADLTFLCAKVRYTVLFDKDDFSSSFIEADVDFVSAEANNIQPNTAVCQNNQEIYSSDFINNLKDFVKPHKRVKYPNKEDEYQKEYLKDKGPSLFVDDLDILPVNTSWDNENHRAWQGTLYVTENLNSANDSKSKITYEAKGTGVKDSYDLILPPSERVVKRGTLYDIVSKLKTSELTKLSASVNVHDWNLRELSYKLHGPYELIVEKTTLSIIAGERSVLWYRSDIAPEDIRFSFPQVDVGDKKVDFYIANIKTDEKGNYVLADNGEYQIEVRVNPGIPANIFEDYKEEKQTEINYFYIIAGNIHKKIEITSLSLQSFFRVTPNEIVINVKDYITSELERQDLQITIDSNLSNHIAYAFSSIEGNNGEFKICFGDENLDLSNGQIELVDGTGKLKVQLNDFIKSTTFWKTDQTFTLNLTSGSQTEVITFRVKPYYTDYVIHFKVTDPDKAWYAPHIYIYQILQLPVNLSGKYAALAGKTVGYGSNSDSKPATEYIFTNNISFKGWKNYGGTFDLESENVEFIAGFVHIGSVDNESGDRRFNPENYNSDIYNYIIDLNSEHSTHKDLWTCEECKKLTFQSGNNKVRTYPGIAMEPEGNGWWKYTLSGIATPGKTLIMFNEGHTSARYLTGQNGDGYGYQYPANNQIAIPLFDFPDNEGWFLFDGHSDSPALNFYDEEPSTETALGINDIIRFEWSKNFLGTGETPFINFSRDSSHSSETIGKDGEIDEELFYKEIKVSDYPWLVGAYQLYSIISTEESQEKSKDILLRLEDAVSYENGKYTFKLISNIEEYDGPIYRFYWPMYLGEYVQLWTDSKTFTNSDLTSKGKLDGNLGYFYYDIKDYAEGELKFIINDSDSQRTYYRLSDFKQDGSNQIYCAYVKGSYETELGIPKILWNISEPLLYYLIGDEYGESYNENNRFLRIFKLPNYEIWRLQNINLKNGSEFIIVEKGGTGRYGGYVADGNTTAMKETSLILNYGLSVKNLKMIGDFNGDVYYIDNGENFILYLDPK